MKNKTDNLPPDYSNKIIGSCSLIKDCRNFAFKIASSDAPVLITGDSGTGKELFADLIYKNSLRYGKPFVKINCAAIPESLIESELFGHLKGAFTDASSYRKGKFIAADTGTVFLDEITELPLNTQSRLLRVIENSAVDQLGSENPVKIDIRIISATNRDIEAEVSAGRFRKDLYYRLNVLLLHIPELKNRKDDIPQLVDYFSGRMNGGIVFTSNAMEKLYSYDWPGNVRELENYIKRLSVTMKGKTIKPEDIEFKNYEKNIILPLKTAINKFKKNYIIKALKANEWNQSRTSSVLGIQRTYLSRLINELEIKEEIKE
ncbi:MAG: sigma-54-dependent Fis family transcriptional regulator [Spirochaetales bacterium]|nr:sigma-54-dependent Fis family transcriptional regulator [Spirochaetales bacterium]